jgi:hypothetical protein
MPRHRAFIFLPFLELRSAAYARDADEPWYVVLPGVARTSLIDIPGAVLDGSVTGVGREQDRTNRYLKTQKTLRNSR